MFAYLETLFRAAAGKTGELTSGPDPQRRYLPDGEKTAR
jgi:hypothetical protein